MGGNTGNPEIPQGALARREVKFNKHFAKVTSNPEEVSRRDDKTELLISELGLTKRTLKRIFKKVLDVDYKVGDALCPLIIKLQYKLGFVIGNSASDTDGIFGPYTYNKLKEKYSDLIPKQERVSTYVNKRKVLLTQVQGANSSVPRPREVVPGVGKGMFFIGDSLFINVRRGAKKAVPSNMRAAVEGLVKGGRSARRMSQIILSKPDYYAKKFAGKDKVAFQGYTNEVSYTSPNRAWTKYIQPLFKFILERSRAQIHICLVPPQMGYWERSYRKRGKSEAFIKRKVAQIGRRVLMMNALYKRFARQNPGRVVIVDTYNSLVDPNKPGYMHRKFCGNDGVHYSGRTGKEIAKAVIRGDGQVNV